MDTNWGVGVGVDLNAPPPTGGDDWRAQLLPEARSRVVNKMNSELEIYLNWLLCLLVPPYISDATYFIHILHCTCRMECLKKHLPVSVPEGLNELQIIAVRFEDKIYTAATSQSDYLRKISLKMLSMETKAQQAPGNAQVIPNLNNPGQASCLRMPDGTPWRPIQGSDPAAVAAAAGVDPNAPPLTGGDWRPQLQPEARSRIVNKITECLKKHLPVSVPEGLNELQKFAVRSEEKIYTAATSQADYLRKISLKILSMEKNT
ncbi:unnamed protein product [Triticum turgidum subsp. durum]|uniref:Mediator complex subunit 15 KIX domain-containing protein n=1 Tax=Triticum turgidum subsp. durum TaxID=4567 RepID=A0A9R1Q4E9_TRITD|nr:unnamed protein product [Triticum turgidum subsp. durum]